MMEDQFKQSLADKDADLEYLQKRNDSLETENTALKLGNRALQEKEGQVDQLKREVNHL